MKLGIIPARGGSKRIPKKNIKDFLGKPIIAYSIETALSSDLFDEIMVSTDDEEIAEVSLSFGAKVPFLRSAKNSNDFATTSDVIREVIFEYQKKKIEFDFVCCIYATAPLIMNIDLCEGFKIIENNKWDFVFSATKFEFPIYRSLKLDKNNSIEMNYPEHLNTRSQDLPIMYHDAGQFYWGKSEAWQLSKKIFSGQSTIIELPTWRVQDIDTLEDWEITEYKFQYMNSKRNFI
jgi:pseudaminic acid cytidylyltransferase